jgi:Amt family ammonium transporter
MNGCLSGLVAITAGCGTVENWAAVCIGAVAGLIYLGGSAFLIRCRIDDAVDAIPVHMFNGIWGVISTGLLSSPGGVKDAYGTSEYAGWFYEVSRGSLDATLFLNQILCVLFVCGWVTFTMMVGIVLSHFI